MPSYRLRSSSLTVPSRNQVDNSKALLTSENIALVDQSRLRLPPIKVDPMTLLDLENFGIMLPSLGDGSNPLRSSLEFSEEESTSDESASQRSSFPQWDSKLTSELDGKYTYEAYCNQSDARKSSGSAISSTPSDRLHVLERQSANQKLTRPSIRPSNSMHGFKHTFLKKLDNALVLEEREAEKESDSRVNASSHSSVSPKEQFSNYRVNPSTLIEHIPCCQSDTMHSVFEDDSDDEDVPYLKKVLTWIPKKSKLDKAQPNMKKQKSRLFKNAR